MDLNEMIKCCLALPEVEETTQFGSDVLVYKVAGKMFVAINPDDVPAMINLKCDPDRALELRDRYEKIQPGWYMNKQHWNILPIEANFQMTCWWSSLGTPTS